MAGVRRTTGGLELGIPRGSDSARSVGIILFSVCGTCDYSRLFLFFPAGDTCLFTQPLTERQAGWRLERFSWLRIPS